MLLIEFKEGQGLGNQLWNYAALRSIAQYKGYTFKVVNYENFKGKNFIKIKKSNSKKNIQRNKYTQFKEKCFYDNDLSCFVYGYDKEVLNVQKNTFLDGVFQSEKYLMPNINVINDFFEINLKNFNPNFDYQKTCILNIRGGEYKMHKELILPKAYWLNGIKNMQEKFSDLEFKIVTDDINYASKLLPHLEILKGNIKNDFINLYFSKYLILSNSSFAYFPTKLGIKPNYVIAPINWSRFDNKYNRWVSHANFYSEWNWQNKEGFILSKEETISSVNKSEEFYNSYNVLTSENYFRKFKINYLLPRKLKNKIKQFLGKIFPLFIG